MMESSPDTRVHNCGPMATETNGNGKAGREFHTPEKEAGRHAATRSLPASQARKEGTVQHSVYSTATQHNTCAGRPHPIVADVVSYAATSPRKLSHYPVHGAPTHTQSMASMQSSDARSWLVVAISQSSYAMFNVGDQKVLTTLGSRRKSASNLAMAISRSGSKKRANRAI